MGTDQKRIYGENISICGGDVQKFYNNRARKTGASLTSVNLNRDADISRRRDEKEKSLIIPELGLVGTEKVLEIGCGLGRFVSALDGRVREYVGIDFSDELIRIAKQQFEGKDNIHFQVMSATDIKVAALTVSLPFHLIMSMGLMVYLNDADVKRLLRKMVDMAGQASSIYIRESVSVMEQRLTLKEFPSEELDASYSAIYRTVGEYLEFFEETLYPKGFELVESELFLDASLGARKETNQQFFLLKRRG